MANLPPTSYVSFMSINYPCCIRCCPDCLRMRRRGSLVTQARGERRSQQGSVAADDAVAAGRPIQATLHFETQDTRVLVTTFAKPGELGEWLRLHASGPPCSVVAPRLQPMQPVTYLTCFSAVPSSAKSGSRQCDAGARSEYDCSVDGSMLLHHWALASDCGPDGDSTETLTSSMDQHGGHASGVAAAAPDAEADLPGIYDVSGGGEGAAWPAGATPKAPLEVPVVDSGGDALGELRLARKSQCGGLSTPPAAPVEMTRGFGIKATEQATAEAKCGGLSTSLRFGRDDGVTGLASIGGGGGIAAMRDPYLLNAGAPDLLRGLPTRRLSSSRSAFPRWVRFKKETLIRQ